MVLVRRVEEETSNSGAENLEINTKLRNCMFRKDNVINKSLLSSLTRNGSNGRQIDGKLCSYKEKTINGYNLFEKGTDAVIENLGLSPLEFTIKNGNLICSKGLTSDVYSTDLLIIEEGLAPEIKVPDGDIIPFEIPSTNILGPIRCAAKILHWPSPYIPEFINEVRTLARLKEHENIAKFICCGIVNVLDENPSGLKCNRFWPIEENRLSPEFLEYVLKAGSGRYRMMTLMENSGKISLWDWLQDNINDLNRRLWIKFAKQLLSALVFLCESNVAHLDIKPDNIVVRNDMRLTLVDFGTSLYDIESNSGSSDHPGMGLCVGNMVYTAPELLVGVSKDYRKQDRPSRSIADCYSMGVTFWTIISGKRPFSRAKSPIMILQGIKKGFFVSGLQERCNATPEVTSSDYTKWHLKFPSGDPVGIDIQKILSMALEVDPEKRADPFTLNEEVCKLE